MGGKGELVKYTRLFEKGPLSPHEKAVLKEKINAIIDAASHTITIEAFVEAVPQDIIMEVVDRMDRHKGRGK
jgi:hypothetical protein